MPQEFLYRYSTPRRPATEARVRRMRVAVLARLRGFRAPVIARSLGVSAHTVRDMLRELGMTITQAHWQHGGYSCFGYRLEALGVSDEEIKRTGARRHGDLDLWVSVDTRREPRAARTAGRRKPSPRWLAERVKARVRWQSRA